MSLEQVHTSTEVNSTGQRDFQHWPTNQSVATSADDASRQPIQDSLGRDDAVATTIEARTFRFATTGRLRGLVRCGGAILLTAICLFLLSEIPDTPSLRLEMSLISGIGLISAAVLFGLAARDFLGAITINNAGITVTPAIIGFRVPWSALRTWTLRVDPYSSHSITLKLYGAEPRSVPSGLLSQSQLTEIWQILRLQANSKEATSVQETVGTLADAGNRYVAPSRM
jgi:hypothetical protein